jgi:hypothetical protein
LRDKLGKKQRLPLLRAILKLHIGSPLPALPPTFPAASFASGAARIIRRQIGAPHKVNLV